MRVIAGSARGRRIEAPGGRGTRPTTDRVREATFNSLNSLGLIEDARVLDLFAGSGAMGIEALSRGARHATFVESSRGALQVIGSNLETTGFTPASTVVSGDAFKFLEAGSSSAGAGEFDLVFVDPPYALDRRDELLAVIEAGCAGAAVVIESDADIELPDEWSVLRRKRYGGTLIVIAHVTARDR